MQFGQQSIAEVKGAASVQRLCDRCGNVSDHVLVDQPYAIGIGIPFMRPLGQATARMPCLPEMLVYFESPRTKHRLIRRGRSKE